MSANVLCRGPMWWKGLSEIAMSRFEAIRQGLTEAIAYEKGIAMLEEKNADLRYVIELTEDQARVTARACELYARLLNGQLDEINHELLLHENHNNICERRDQAMDLLLKLKQIYFPELHGHGHSYGVGHDEVSDRAWLVYQALRYCIAWHDHPEGGHGVDFYRPMAFGGGPVPKCEAKE